MYLWIDYRVGDNSNANPPAFGTLMPWVAQMGFVDTGEKLDIDESNDGDIDQYLRIYKAQFQAGTITLSNKIAAIYMYGIGAIRSTRPSIRLPWLLRTRIRPGLSRLSIQLDGTITDETAQKVIRVP